MGFATEIDGSCAMIAIWKDCAKKVIMIDGQGIGMADELKEDIVAHTEELSEEKKTAEAKQGANELTSLGEKDAIAWFVKGRVHYEAGEFEDALSAFSKAAGIAKENPEVWHMMGYALISLKRYKEAKDALEYVAKVQPENTEAVCALGICLVILGDGKAAKGYLNSAVRQNRAVSVAMIEHFHDKFFGQSKDASASTKALIERCIEMIKVPPVIF